MKIILKSDVEGLGNLGEIVTVKPGYARNYLIPKGFAIEATEGNLRQFETEKEAWKKKQERLREEQEKLKAAIEGVSLTFTRRAGEDEKLFGSVTSMDIAAALREKGFHIDKRSIQLDEPIKTLGEFNIGVKLAKDIVATVKVQVAKEE
ncbi:MAG TPA: 50S ribosomal protein L9 [Deltaproteobacteria bacterium]|nr:50S ribosomal protein L9 [Deltaproteobacteria bacterium]